MNFMWSTTRTAPPDHGHSITDSIMELYAEEMPRYCEQKADAALILASRLGHFEEVCALVERARDFNAYDETGRTALHWAARFGHLKIMRKLLEGRGIDVNSTGDLYWTPLYEAVKHDNRLHAIKLLIDHGAELNGLYPMQRSVICETVLHYALRYNYQDVAGLLIQAGADVNGVKPMYNALAQCLVRKLFAMIPLITNAGGRLTWDVILGQFHHQRMDCKQFMLAQRTTMLTLKQICRLTVRKCLVDHARGRSILGKIEELEIPTELKAYLSLKL